LITVVKKVAKIRHGEELRRMLINRSEQALKRAQEEIFSEKLVSRKAQAAMRYYAKNWKEIPHSGLLSLACEVVGGTPQRVVDAQVAMLFFSAAIDIHDDIIDNSKKKQGKITLLGKFGRDIAILIGNAFMVKGFLVLNKLGQKLSQDVRDNIFKIAKCALFGTGEAHALELEFKNKMKINPEEYLNILERKGAVIEGEMEIGAIIGGGSKAEINALKQYGRIFGLLGTLREEFVDIFEVQELNNRVRNECLPIPIMYALQDKKIEKKLHQLLSKKEITQEDAWNIIDLIFSANQVKQLRHDMEVKIKEAIAYVAILKDSHAKLLLCDLASSMLEDL
jgi:geranylgeranyl pyrophosphate synthase